MDNYIDKMLTWKFSQEKKYSLKYCMHITYLNFSIILYHLDWDSFIGLILNILAVIQLI